MRLKVLKAHSSSYPDPISFIQGDELKLGGLDEEYKGWIRVKTKDNNQGWAPIE
jgi:hypothetical protein